MDLDVGPGNVAHEALATDPGLEARGVKAAREGDAVEVDVGDGGGFGGVLA